MIDALEEWWEKHRHRTHKLVWMGKEPLDLGKGVVIKPGVPTEVPHDRVLIALALGCRFHVERANEGHGD